MKQLFYSLLAVLMLIAPLASGQNFDAFNTRTLIWKEVLHQGDEKFPLGQVEGFGFQAIGTSSIPLVYERIPIANPAVRVTLNVLKTSTTETFINNVDLQANFDLVQWVSYQKGQPVLNIKLTPARRVRGTIELLELFNFTQTQAQVAYKQQLGKLQNNTTTSVLSTGKWHQFSVDREGIYKLTGKQLADAGIDVSGVAANTIKIYGHRGGPLSEVIGDVREDDLAEFPVELIDQNGNGKFESNDYIRFYCGGPDAWIWNEDYYRYEKNLYATKAFVYLTFGGDKQKTLTSAASGSGLNPEISLDYYYQLYHHEKDEVNFIKSGRYWYGNSFRSTPVQNFTVDFANVRTDLPAYFQHEFAGRSIGVTSNGTVSVNGQAFHNFTIIPVPGDYDETFGRLIGKRGEFTATGNQVNVSYVYNDRSNDGDGWISFFNLEVPGELVLSGNQKMVRNKDAAKYDVTRFVFANSSNHLWNVTDPINPQKQQVESANGKLQATFQNNKVAPVFALFKDGGEFSPSYVTAVQNQNLHGVSGFDFIIITHKSFQSEAERLAQFHRDQYGQLVQVIEVSQIYHEFSAGKQDVTALRDFIRMVYKRGQSSGTPLENVLLFGDGSYDFLNRISDNTNYIPTFQSRNTENPTNSYSSDDYFAILDDQEGYYDLSLLEEDLDIGIGRIPCRSLSQAQTMVNKIIHYHDAPSFGDWRNRVTFLGDDEDGSRHLDDSERVAGFVASQEPIFNIDKIYLDAFEQQSYGSGEKYPDVNLAITKSFEKGNLVFNYLGHGGASGLAHERVMTRDEIRSWTNYDKLPLMVTATCELSRFDDPEQDSPGELMLFNQGGGAVALVTTMRLVRITLNTELSNELWNKNILDLSRRGRTLGDIFIETKNATSRAVNQRNFSLLGDPAMQLGVPQYKVVTTQINDSIVGSQALDTLRAFSKVKVEGEIQNWDGTIRSDFNGFVSPTIYDKFTTYQSLGNDPASYIRDYQLQNSVLYRGKVSVVNGKFSFVFVVPKDIAYQFGPGKISYYAENGAVDAHGYFDSIYVGGSISQTVQDKDGPDIQLYLNDQSWVFGGTTNEHPLLLCSVYDDNGINTVGNGIGRDITAVLDAGTPQEQTIILNDFYSAKLDSYQEGEIEYQLEDLSPGKHTLKIRVWDVYNNVSEDYTEFMVAEDEDLTINNLLNFPNPFTTSTVFHFDHNRVGESLDVQLQIVTPTGRIVKSFVEHLPSAQSHFDRITWDGTDEFGDRLARGVYLYKLTVRDEGGTVHEETQKLVLLK